MSSAPCSDCRTKALEAHVAATLINGVLEHQHWHAYGSTSAVSCQRRLRMLVVPYLGLGGTRPDVSAHCGLDSSRGALVALCSRQGPMALMLWLNGLHDDDDDDAPGSISLRSKHCCVTQPWSAGCCMLQAARTQTASCCQPSWHDQANVLCRRAPGCSNVYQLLSTQHLHNVELSQHLHRCFAAVVWLLASSTMYLAAKSDVAHAFGLARASLMSASLQCKCSSCCCSRTATIPVRQRLS
jgi:hypothetical protein